MQTHAPAAAHQAKQEQTKTALRPAQLMGEQQGVFVDKRPEMMRGLQLRQLMDKSRQAAEGRALQMMLNNSVQASDGRAVQAMLNNSIQGRDAQVFQRVAEEEPLQAKAANENTAQFETKEAQKPNNTGLPDNLKSGIESLSGMGMDHVKVHYNSAQPAQLNAHAYAQGSDIHVAPGQEQHLPHEAWHVVQQAQGRVKPTMQMKAGVPVNDDVGLEAEADVMGARALQTGAQVVQEKPVDNRPAVNGVRHNSGGAVRQLRLPPGVAVMTQILHENDANALLMVHRLLHMEIAQGRLLKPDGVAYATADEASGVIFPGGIFDLDAYNIMYAANQQYAQILPASQAITDGEWLALEPALARAADLAGQCAGRTLWIKQIFGDNVDDVAAVQATYRRVAARLGGFGRINFTIDHHGDDAEMGVGGYTVAGSAKIQVSPRTIAGNPNTLAVLLMHEGCHEVDASIIDCGYYGTANFTQMSRTQKKTNAAHYEEVARRLVGSSRYDGQTFTPVVQQAVQAGPRRELIRKVRVANEGLRGLWAQSGNLHAILRDIGAGVSTLSPEVQLSVARLAKSAFSLPEAVRLGAPSVTTMDLAMLEATTKVFSRAQTEVNSFKNEADAARRLLLVAMTPKELAIDAVNRVGGFQGVDPAINVTAIDQFRTAVVLAGLPDPFPAFE